MVAPKAAALLEIPLRENGAAEKRNAYAMYKAKRTSKLSESDSDKIDEEDVVEELRPSSEGNFNRGAFRLSMSSKRRNAVWSSFSSTSSM